MTNRLDTKTHCHCGADYNGSDHCPHCQCEQYEQSCEDIFDNIEILRGFLGKGVGAVWESNGTIVLTDHHYSGRKLTISTDMGAESLIISGRD